MSRVPTACTPFDADLSALLDGELDTGREAELRTHLADCDGCRARLEALGRVDEALRALAATPVEAERGARLRDRIAVGPARATPARRAGPPRRRRRLARVTSAAALAAGLVLALLWAPWRSTEPGPVVARVEPGAPEPPAATAPATRPVPDDDALPFALTLHQSSDEDIELAEGLGRLGGVETAQDLEVIEQLDLLERLVDLERRGRS